MEGVYHWRRILYDCYQKFCTIGLAIALQNPIVFYVEMEDEVILQDVLSTLIIVMKPPQPHTPWDSKVFGLGIAWPMEGVAPNFANLKEEMLRNRYVDITADQWNAALKKCQQIMNGEFTAFQRRKWSRRLRAQSVKLKHLLVLKLYTDFDLLQREFRKTYRDPYNKIIDRLQSFVHWRRLLTE